MAIYKLIEEPLFPDPVEAEDGLLAVGGDLSPLRLLNAYANGIFPWYSNGEPIMWWSPDPRTILLPEELKISKSLQRVLRSEKYSVTYDQQFEKVIGACAQVPRKDEDGTWITEEMKEAYIALHQLGFAHSVEVFYQGRLVGGLYGVSIGGAFFGESMFHTLPNASKVALCFLMKHIKAWGFDFVDAQLSTEHLIRMGAKEVSRLAFLERLEEAVKKPTKKGNWGQDDHGVFDAVH